VPLEISDAVGRDWIYKLHRRVPVPARDVPIKGVKNCHWPSALDTEHGLVSYQLIDIQFVLGEENKKLIE
jgi:hypothetical protein